MSFMKSNWPGDEMRLNKCKLIELPKFSDQRGSLTFIESDGHVPFDIERVYYLYDIPGGAERGAHAHLGLQQLIVAMSGSFDVVLDDGVTERRFHLNHPNYGLYVCPMMWRSLENFSPDAVCLVLASSHFDEGDYIRNYDDYLDAARIKIQ